MKIKVTERVANFWTGTLGMAPFWKEKSLTPAQPTLLKVEQSTGNPSSPEPTSERAASPQPSSDTVQHLQEMRGHPENFGRYQPPTPAGAAHESVPIVNVADQLMDQARHHSLPDATGTSGTDHEEETRV